MQVVLRMQVAQMQVAPMPVVQMLPAQMLAVAMLLVQTQAVQMPEVQKQVAVQMALMSMTALRQKLPRRWTLTFSDGKTKCGQIQRHSYQTLKPCFQSLTEICITTIYKRRRAPLSFKSSSNT